MSILRFAVKSFRRQAGRGILVSIVLSALLISAVLNIGSSLRQTLYEEAISEAGNAHAKILNIRPGEQERLSENPAVEWAETMETLQMPAFPKGKKETAIGFLHLPQLGEGRQEGFRLVSGTAPRAEGEAALPPHVAELLGIEPVPGQEFELETENPDGTAETLRFVVTGILQEERALAAAGVNGVFVSRAFAERYGATGTGDSRKDLFVHIRDGFPARETVKELTETVGIPEERVEFNERYLGLSENNPWILPAVVGAVCLLLFTGALVIYNAFSILVVKRIHDYGMLTLVGASRRQVRRCVYLEGLLNAGVALPLGLLLGTAVSFAALPLLKNAMQGVVLVYSVSPWSYLLAAALTVLMTFLGVLRPARRASRVAPVEAVKFTGAAEAAETGMAKAGAVEREVTLPVLAKLNRRRNRSRTRATLLTLSVSGVLFLAVSSVGTFMLGSVDNLARSRIAGDIQIQTGEKVGNDYYYSMEDDPLSPGFLSKLEAIDGVARAEPYRMASYVREKSAKGTSAIERQFGAVAGMSDEALQELLEKAAEGGPALADFKNPRDVLAVNDGGRDGAEPGYRVGQEVTVYPGDALLNSIGEPVAFRVAGVLDSRDVPSMAGLAFGGALPTLYLPESSLAANGIAGRVESVSLTIDEGKYESIYEEVKRLCEETGGVHARSLVELKRELERQYLGALLLVLAVIVIVALIGLLNLISSTAIGVEQRKKEFGILNALGLGPKGLSTVLNYEALYLSLVSIGCSSVFGVGLGYGIFRLLREMGSNYLVFSFPVLPLALLCVVYALAPWLTTRFSLKRLRKHTTVELLGQDI